MLNGTELAVAITAFIIGAMAAGWLLHLLWTRLVGGATDRASLSQMAHRLHEAEEARELAEEAAARAGSLLASREAEMAARLAAMQARLDGELAGREADMARELRESRAEAAAMGEGLGHARRRIAELEARLAQRG